MVLMIEEKNEKILAMYHAVCTLIEEEAISTS